MTEGYIIQWDTICTGSIWQTVFNSG